MPSRGPGSSVLRSGSGAMQFESPVNEYLAGKRKRGEGYIYRLEVTRFYKLTQDSRRKRQAITCKKKLRTQPFSPPF